MTTIASVSGRRTLSNQQRLPRPRTTPRRTSRFRKTLFCLLIFTTKMRNGIVCLFSGRAYTNEGYTLRSQFIYLKACSRDLYHLKCWCHMVSPQALTQLHSRLLAARPPILFSVHLINVCSGR